MARLTSLLLLGAGALVLVTWLVAPASSQPPPVPPPAAAAVPAFPDLDSIVTSLERLSRHDAADVDGTVMTRDPFQFASASTEPSAAERASVDAARLLGPDVSPVAWPRLVAILSSGPAEATVRRAVFEDARQLVRIVDEGGLVADVHVDRITATSVTLTAASGETTHLSID